MRSSGGDHCGGLAEVRRAIDELAADYAASSRGDEDRSPYGGGRTAHTIRQPACDEGGPGAGSQGGVGTGSQPAEPGGEPADRDTQADDLADRLARIWMMISELDPDVARRLPGY